MTARKGILLAVAASHTGLEWRTVNLVDVDQNRSTNSILLPEGIALRELAQGAGATLKSELNPIGAHNVDFGKLSGTHAMNPRDIKLPRPRGFASANERVGWLIVGFPENSFCGLTLEQMAGSSELGMQNLR